MHTNNHSRFTSQKTTTALTKCKNNKAMQWHMHKIVKWHSAALQQQNLVKIGLVVSEISLRQAIVKNEKEKERKKRKESNSSIT